MSRSGCPNLPLTTNRILFISWTQVTGSKSCEANVEGESRRNSYNSTSLNPGVRFEGVNVIFVVRDLAGGCDGRITQPCDNGHYPRITRLMKIFCGL